MPGTHKCSGQCTREARIIASGSRFNGLHQAVRILQFRDLQFREFDIERLSTRNDRQMQVKVSQLSTSFADCRIGLKHVLKYFPKPDGNLRLINCESSPKPSLRLTAPTEIF
jgi:hypothetical protein